MPRIDWVLPAYNPSSGWAGYAAERLQAIAQAFPDCDFYLFIVTDGSTMGHDDVEREVLRTAFADQLTYIDYSPNQGKGYALRTAVARTGADYVIYTDWDFPFTHESYLSALTCLLSDDVDLVVPQRNRINYLAHLSPMRRFLSVGSSYINRLLLALPTKDTQGGIKAFNTKGRQLFLSTTIERFLFDTEFVALCVRRGLSLGQTPCDVRAEIRLSGMGLKTLGDEFGNIIKLIRARWFS